MANYAGIDYSCGSGANQDNETGIRYGVIAINSLASHIWDDIENIYQSSCPHCYTDLPDEFSVDLANEDLDCPFCGKLVTDESQWPEEPSGKAWKGDSDYQLEFTELYCFVTKAPVAIKATFCSPCMPGAGDLDSPNPDGILTYALDPSFFDEYSPMPYEQSDLIEVSSLAPKYDWTNRLQGRNP